MQDTISQHCSLEALAQARAIGCSGCPRERSALPSEICRHISDNSAGVWSDHANIPIGAFSYRQPRAVLNCPDRDIY